MDGRILDGSSSQLGGDTIRGLGKGPTKRQPKDSSKIKAGTSSSGARFQCPRCPKNFSRIENLTRHAANHEDVGKFACVVCRKRFTRSDLLNRHRRIHGAQGESTNAPVIQSKFPDSSPSQSYDSQLDDRRSVSNDGSSNFSNHSPRSSYQIQQPQGLYPGSNVQDGYHPPMQAPTSIMQNHLPQAQGLTSLMEAALAPQDAFSFPPVESINASLWDGFMRFGPGVDTTNTYMGTYDADMSWTLDYLPSENSPNYLLDHDMLNAFEDFGDNPYSYQTLQYELPPPPPPDTEDADGEDEDTTDWPDKIERPGSPHQQPNRVMPVRIGPISWQPVLHEARSSGLTPNTIGPIEMFNDGLRDALLVTLNGANFRNEISRPEISEAIFPPSEVLDFFLRLYVRYVHPRFPVLHLPTFDIYNSSPLLLVAMMFLGSSHSHTDRGRFSRMFHGLLRISIIRIQEVDKRYLRTADNILTYFLLCLAGTWSGSKNSYEFAEGGRGILVTACRRSRLLDCRQSARIEPEAFLKSEHSALEATWLAWIETEKRKRLGLSIYIYDCQYPALFNNQPYVSKAETTNCVFPCAEEFYTAPTAHAWSSLLPPLSHSNPSPTPPTTYYLHALNCCLLRKWIKPPPPIAPTTPLGKTILIYALHTHIFEWRQATSMLNPTGLTGTFGNSAHDMGEGLRERRRWLVDGLDSFAECYKDPSTDIATQLLYYLGYVSLDVSLSDMHLIAGRSANANDSAFAEENLKHWANSSLSDGTMKHIYSMLALCHASIEQGVAAAASYEIAVALFTGGMVCWAFAKLRTGIKTETPHERANFVDHVRRASIALRQMGCWRMCSLFGRILEGFEGFEGNANGNGKGKAVRESITC